jgi:Chitobiase/beta-hexosaminidase C-terminal domain
MTFLLLFHDTSRVPGRRILLPTPSAMVTSLRQAGMGSERVFMKALLLCGLLLMTSLGCGGYGSGMGMKTAPAPTFSPPTGTYPAPQTITINDGVGFAAIYYTIDGTTPTLASPPYRGPFVITQTTRVEAIAAAGGYITSPVAIADYTLQ